MWTDGDLGSYARRAAEALNVAMVLDQCIYRLIHAETDQASRDQITMVRILALKQREKFITQVCEIYASAYSSDELKALVAFLESPAGEAMRKKQSDVQRRIEQTITAFLESLMDESN